MAAETDNYSICLDSASDNSDRTVVRLRCSHVFHLDCIGSAFNASGVMQCPNCRQYENGTWKRFPNTILEECIDEETDDDDEFLQFNPSRQSEYHSYLINERFRPLMHTEVSASHVIRRCHTLRTEPVEFPGIRDHIIRANHTTIASAASGSVAEVEYVRHLLSDEGDRNDPIFQRSQPFSNSSPTPVNASMIHDSSSNGFLGSGSNRLAVNSSIGLFRTGRNDYNNFPLMQPSRNSPSPAVLASMASGRREFNGFLGNEAIGHPVVHAGSPSLKTRYSFNASSSEQTKDLFHAASSSEKTMDVVHEGHTAPASEPTGNLFHDRLATSTSEQTRDFFHRRHAAPTFEETMVPINLASINITSQNEPPAAIHPPRPSEESDDIATFEYLLDVMDSSSASYK